MKITYDPAVITKINNIKLTINIMVNKLFMELKEMGYSQTEIIEFLLENQLREK